MPGATEKGNEALLFNEYRVSVLQDKYSPKQQYEYI
jgi:hypothetical protein